MKFHPLKLNFGASFEAVRNAVPKNAVITESLPGLLPMLKATWNKADETYTLTVFGAESRVATYCLEQLVDGKFTKAVWANRWNNPIEVELPEQGTQILPNRIVKTFNRRTEDGAPYTVKVLRPKA